MSSLFHSLLTGIDIITAFKLRVAADSGTFESETCIRAELNALGTFYNRFGIIITPNGYKANKIYALKPISGGADLATVRATTATRINSSGVVAAVATGIPRLNTRSGYTCPEQLVEFTAGTNLLLRSEEIDNASWTKTNMTVSANATTSPDGTSIADSVLETVTSGQHRIEQAKVKAGSALLYTLTFYIKPNGRDWVYVSLRNGGNGVNVYLNITTVVRGTPSTFGSNWTFNSVQIQDAGSGWRKVEMQVQSDSTTSITTIIAAQTGNSVSADYAGDITKGFYVWGVQLEQATFSTSYIPTTSAAVTRNSETITSKTGLSSLLGTSGTIYFKGFVNFDGTDKRIQLSDGTTNNRVTLTFSTANVARVGIVTGGVAQADIGAPDVFRSDSELRVVIVFASNDVRLYVNGILVGTDTSATMPSGLDRLDFTTVAQNFSGSWRALAVSNTALTNAQAITLSTPVAYPPTIKKIIQITLTGNPDYYGFGNGVNLNSFFPDYSIYLAKRGPSHYLDGGNGFGMLYNAKFNLWTTPFETIDDGTTYYSGHSAGLVGNQIFVQVSRYTVAAMVDTFIDIGYFTSVDLTTLTSAEDLKLSGSWNAFVALPAPVETRYEAYGKILPSTATANRYFAPWFQHDGTNHRLEIRVIDVVGVDNFTFSLVNVWNGTNDYGEPSLVHCGTKRLY
jgi:hypothetical protein